MTVRLFMQGERVGQQLRRRAKVFVKEAREAERGAAQDTVEWVLPRARADISSAGKFGSRWTQGFKGTITEGGGFIKISFTQAVPYWRVFQYGATIRGRPLLWIPLSFASDAQGVMARDYPGKLFRVNRKGGKAPLLATGNPFSPKYFGKESVRIPKKFHLLEIIRDGAKQMKTFYSARRKK